MSIRILAAASLIALAGCTGGGGDGNNATASKGDGDVQGQGRVLDDDDVRLRAGQWETKTEVNAPGMPAEVAAMMKNQAATTTTMCISEEEANRSDANIFTGKKDKNCTTEGFEAKHGRVKGTVTCTGTAGEGRMTMAVDGAFKRDSYEVTTRMDMQGMGSESMKMETRVTGRRLGDCPAGAKA